jgi:hypothetical protein
MALHAAAIPTLKPVCGCVLVVLSLARTFERYLLNVTSMLGNMIMDLTTSARLFILADTDQELFDFITGTYFVIIEFCIEAKNNFMKDYETNKASFSNKYVSHIMKGKKM